MLVAILLTGAKKRTFIAFCSPPIELSGMAVDEEVEGLFLRAERAGLVSAQAVERMRQHLRDNRYVKTAAAAAMKQKG
eukprot:COSAG02_NODE_16364_length_1089_cov_21.506061_1_plen_78_part_00